MATRKSSKSKLVAVPEMAKRARTALDARVEEAVMGLDRIYRIRFKVAQAIEDDNRNDASLFLDLIASEALLHGKVLDATARTGLFDHGNVPTQEAPHG